MIGIYFIKSNRDNKLYIGSTCNYRKRINNHLSELRNNTHHCIKLQRSFNKYGEDNFSISLIEETSLDNLLIREQYWIDLLNPFYNSNKKVSGWNKITTSEETRNKISKSKDKYKREVYQFDILGNYLNKYCSITEAAKSLGIKNTAHISSVCKGKRAYAYKYRWSYTPEPVLVFNKKVTNLINNYV